ncbi:Ferredoxin subunit of nitrite reductase or a ring-hydroxylating dioxygenase [Sinosporangium album]|uniref:Ferredoxin subunit of nitrite reductase or a ring-hydroxylating dioxygenase n=1 Tax=Sinosporangium album TaxID=504805 RepID=A0A1G7WH72_9ACTN|nr:Rieske (2Fe-2S) protein [Sinosporangium album]SDG71301.1 Ferredoxin subunit of nitrite reductase or a ring-hydroxylating dioxygenase [Sinosporangium album]
MTETTRRAVMTGAGGAGLAAVLAACGGAQETAAQNPAGDAPAAGAGVGAGAGAGKAVLAKTGDIPVGGGKIFAEEKVVITQPAAGEFRAFSASCTHQGCTVAAVSTTINCPCHGAKFNIADGSVVNQPSSGTGGRPIDPLPKKNIRLDGESIMLP